MALGSFVPIAKVVGKVGSGIETDGKVKLGKSNEVGMETEGVGKANELGKLMVVSMVKVLSKTLDSNVKVSAMVVLIVKAVGMLKEGSEMEGVGMESDLELCFLGASTGLAAARVVARRRARKYMVVMGWLGWKRMVVDGTIEKFMSR